MEKRYVAVAEPGHRSVTVMRGTIAEYSLEPSARLSVRGYVVDRWWWGDTGDQCRALALAILLDVWPDAREADRFHRLFCRQVIAHLHTDRWSLEGEQVFLWMRRAVALRRQAECTVSRALEQAPGELPQWPFGPR